jgi:hypothetical protein
MATDLDSSEDAPSWVEAAANPEPLALPEPPPSPYLRDARRALLLGVAGVLCLGFVLGPLALARGKRVKLALGGDLLADRDAGTAEAAIVLGKVGMAIHLTIVSAILPWILFVLPFLHQARP